MRNGREASLQECLVYGAESSMIPLLSVILKRIHPLTQNINKVYEVLIFKFMLDKRALN